MIRSADKLNAEKWMALFRNRGDDQSPGLEIESQVSEPQVVPAIPEPPPPPRVDRGEVKRMANIGKSISIKGDVEGDEDTVIEGRVEGRVTLKNHHLTIGPNGDVQGEVSGQQVTIVGKVAGNVVASDRIEVRETGHIQGDLISPRLSVAEGAVINGAVTMKPAAAAPIKKQEKAAAAAP